MTIYHLSYTKMTKPIINWVGGKRTQTKYLHSLFPDNYEYFIEPFFGGGAVYFHIEPSKAIISDSNESLMTMYQDVKDDVELVIDHLRILLAYHHKDQYYRIRDIYNTKDVDSSYRSACFIYLNKCAYGGMYRVNMQGHMNTPYGKPPVCVLDDLRTASKALERATIMSCSFELIPVKANAFYYLDPPYMETFQKYTQTRFDLDCHSRLLEWCNAINDAGSKFLMSNSNTDAVTSLYKGYEIIRHSTSQGLMKASSKSSKLEELLIKNY